MSAAPQGNGVDRLRELLGLAKTDQDVGRIEERLEDRVVRTKDVADVLPESVRAASESGRLAPALDETVSSGLAGLVRREPELVGEMLFPVIGPAIRRAIAEAMKGLVQGLNTAMEQKFSSRGLSWRMESWRSGVPFREVVLKHTLEYRVRQVFLIDRKSGLLMSHAGDEDALGLDEDAVSAMLTAIQDFVRDSIGDDDSEALSSAELDDETLWVLTGPHSQLAVVIDGYPPRGLRSDLAERLENMHGSYDLWLGKFPDGGEAPAGLNLILNECLQSKLKQSEGGGSPGKAIALLAVLALVIAALIGWWWWQDRQESERVQAVAERIEAMPGRVLIEVDRSGKRPAFRGLADALADPDDALTENLDFGETAPEFTWSPYQSAELEMTLRRVRRTLDPPDSVGIGATDGRIVIAGAANEDWFNRVQNFLQVYNEPWPLDTTRLTLDAPPAPPPPGPDLDELASLVEQVRIGFTRGTEPAPDAPEQLQTLFHRLDTFVANATRQGAQFEVQIVGRTDSLGGPSVNEELRMKRAQWLEQQLLNAGANIPYRLDTQQASSSATVSGRYAAVAIVIREGET